MVGEGGVEDIFYAQASVRAMASCTGPPMHKGSVSVRAVQNLTSMQVDR